VFVTELGEHDLRHDHQQHHQPADELVGHQHLNEDAENRNERDVNRPREHVPRQVLAELVVAVSPQSLDGKGADDRGRHRREQDERDRQDLWQRERPVRSRTGVKHLVQS
jgi:hypothetical protein